MKPTPVEVRKILITNIVSLNIGDAAILWGTIKILQKKYGPDVEVTVFDKEADIAKKYYPWANFHQSLFSRKANSRLGRTLQRYGYGHWNNRLKFIRYYLAVWLIKRHLVLFSRFFVTKNELKYILEYTSADLILSSGGTYLIENYNLNPAILDYYLSIATKNPFGFFTQTLGPFKSIKIRKAFKKIFSRASVILLRDEQSKSNIIDLGIQPENMHLSADAAFVLAQCDDKLTYSIPDRDLAPEIAISVRSMKYFDEEGNQSISYYEGISLAIKIAVEEFGAKITFLSTCQGIPEYWTNDANTADEIYALLPEEIRKSVRVDRKFRQPWEVVKNYQSFDAVLATRMHAAILSICAGTPTIGFAYEFKMEELFKNIDMSELVLSIDSMSEEDVERSIRKLLSNRDFYQSHTQMAATSMCNKAWMAGGDLPELPDK